MTEKELMEVLGRIQSVDESSRSACMEHWNAMGKPLHSLGKLEGMWADLAGIQRDVRPAVDWRALIVMCADNGVVAEGVTQTGQEVTAIVAENFFDKMTCTSLWCRKNRCDQYIVDIGMATDTPRTIRKKIACGTKNMVEEPAMTREEAVAAIGVGVEMAMDLKEQGYQLLLTGEMGIGNTTTSSAVTAVLLNQPVERVTGRGAGLSTEGLERKKAAIAKAIHKHQPNAEDPIDVLSKVGGFDLAGLAGIFLGGAVSGLPVVIDGFISLTAALVAVRLAPACADYLLPSHMSCEPGARLLTESLGLSPGICMDLSLGEGSGAVALLPFLDMAAEAYNKMGSFEDIHVKAYEELR